ncbi:hypothetical protein EK21DRAFT_117771 [Setomelanomma holmii]|uniref:Uncharacterized protein n=1 Tax=Setomelanomma holmii TaxID=210430 RepID=A0A9P4LGK9_9PLEO|nr:hypothetical protein EK21DRAFT_117771 [Setomelanomma holmii]
MAISEPHIPFVPTNNPPKRNRSMNNLLVELDEDTDLLNHLPYQRCTFQPQDEIPGAFGDRLLYGDMMDEKGELWVYFTHLGGAQNSIKQTGVTRMITFYQSAQQASDRQIDYQIRTITDQIVAAQNGGAPVRIQKVKDAALASTPWKQARDGFHILALAKYYFIKRGVDEKLHAPISTTTYKDDLVSAAKAYKAAHQRQELAKQVAVKALQERLARTVATHLARHLALEHMRLLRSERAPDHIESPPSIARQPSLRPHIGYFPSASPQRPQSSSLVRLTSPMRDTMVDKYVALQAEKEELDRQIVAAETEDSEIMAELTALKDQLRVVDQRKLSLMEKRERITAEKKGLQSSLGPDELLQFGFEAGR